MVNFLIIIKSDIFDTSGKQPINNKNQVPGEMKIVVIEDNPDIIDVVDYILTGDGHEMIPCTDGSIASRLDDINPTWLL